MIRFAMILLALAFLASARCGTCEAATAQELTAQVRSQLSSGQINAAVQTLRTLEAQHPNSHLELLVLKGEILLARFERDCHPWSISAGGPVQSVIGRLDQPSGLEMSALSARQYRMRALGLEHPDLAGAHQAFLSAESVQRELPAVVRGLARTHYYRGSKKTALKYLNVAVASYPANADLYHLRGTTEISLGMFQQGSEDLRQAVTLDPGHAEARRRLLEQLYLSGDADSTGIHQDWFLSHRPDDLAASRSYGLAWMKIAVKSRNEQAKNTATELVMSLPRRFPDNWDSWYLAASLATLKRQDAQADAAFTRSLALLNDEINPYRIYRYRATVRQLAGDWSGGLSDASLCMQHEPLSALGCDDYNRSLQFLGRSMETGPAARKFKNLVRLYELHRKLDLNPDDGALWISHAKQLADMEWSDWAFESFRRAEVLLPDAAEPHIGMAEVLLVRREYKRAIEACNRAIELGSGRDAWSIRGDAWLALGEPFKAVSDFERAMRLDETVADAWLLVAKQRIESGDKMGAEEAGRKAIFIAPDRQSQFNKLLKSASTK